MAVWAGSTYKRTKVGLNFVLEPTTEGNSCPSASEQRKMCWTGRDTVLLIQV